MKTKMNIGVMGCASIADRMVIPAIIQSGEFNLIAVASRNPEKANAYASKFNCEAIIGYDELLERTDIEAIYMPLPTGIHLEWALKAIEKGKHLLIEKSLAANYDEAKQIIEATRKKGVLIKENFMFAYHKQLEVVRSILNSGQLGDIHTVRTAFGFPPFPDSNNIRYQTELAGGALLDAGAYTLKISALLLGFDIKVLSSIMNVDDKFGVDVSGSIMMTDHKGTGIQTAYGFNHFYQCQLELWGSLGKLTAPRIFTAGPGVATKISIEKAGSTEQIDLESDNHFINLLNHFHSLIKSGEFESEYAEILAQARLIEETKASSV
jgi:dTDP-3,4-didehydro-2,6-dideoxy-alpha-D-glucose 3-reductase